MHVSGVCYDSTNGKHSLEKAREIVGQHCKSGCQHVLWSSYNKIKADERGYKAQHNEYGAVLGIEAENRGGDNGTDTMSQSA